MKTEAEMIEGAGQTVKPDGTPKDLTPEQAMDAQAKRAEVSLIPVKESGNLTMPKKWQGVCPDRNNSWGDWTNYGFPIHDLAHANNAAARIEQSDNYTVEEKNIIKERIMKAQEKFSPKDEKASKIILEDVTRVINVNELIEAVKQSRKGKKCKTAKCGDKENKEEVVKANGEMGSEAECCCEDCVSREEMGAILQMVGSALDEIYQISMRRCDRIVDQVNEYISEHGEYHLPKLEKTQVRAILNSADILDQFDDMKEPIQQPMQSVWAAKLPKEEIEKLEAIKFIIK